MLSFSKGEGEAAAGRNQQLMSCATFITFPALLRTCFMDCRQESRQLFFFVGRASSSARPFGRPALAWHRRPKGVTSGRLPDLGRCRPSIRCDLLSQSSPRSALHEHRPRQPKAAVTSVAFLARQRGSNGDECRSVPRGSPFWSGVFFVCRSVRAPALARPRRPRGATPEYSSSAGPFGYPYPRPTSASQAREPDSPHGLRPLPHPCGNQECLT
jgi:hypothetical protein